MRLVRYADDFVLMVAGMCEHADGLRDQVSSVPGKMGLRLSDEKTRVCHLDEGFDFWGFRIRRRSQPGSNKRYGYT